MPLNNNRKRWDDALARIDPTRFEALIAEHYRAEGWSVEHVGAAFTGRFTDGDGGIDLKLRRAGQYVIVQCKRWNAKQVPHNAVHELIGVMTTAGATGAVLVTCGEFTRAALRAARDQSRIELVDGHAVRRWIDVSTLEAQARHEPKADWDTWTRVPPRPREPRPPGPSFAEVLRACVPAVVCVLAILCLIGVATTVAHHYVSPTYAKSLPAPAHAESVSPRPTAAPTLKPAGSPPIAKANPMPGRPDRLNPIGQAAAQSLSRATKEVLRQSRIPDVTRPIDREAARQATRKLDGVRSAFWIDRQNLMVMVDGSERRSMAMIDQVCIALQPLGDTLAVIVNLQDITAQNPDAATTLTRNCQLPLGQRAFGQRKRQLDVVGAETRAVFKDQQVGE